MPTFEAMSFLRRETKRGHTYLSICENYRDEAGKVQRRLLHNLGNVNKFTPEAIERIGRQLIELVKGPDIAAITDIKEVSRHNYGFPVVIHRLLCIYSLDIVLHRIARNYKLGYSLAQHVSLMLCDRLNDPLSKLGSYNLQNNYVGLGEPVTLQHLYRTLDHLATCNQLIQTHIYNKHANLFNYEFDVVFYDVTTFYFDSDVVEEGKLRQMGFGKDGKIGKTQILFSLLIDKNKVPIGFQIFKGDKYEGHTFKEAIKTLKEKYRINRIIVVADSGMLNNDNLNLFDEGMDADGYEYIVGDRLKSLSETAVAHLTNMKNYKPLKLKDTNDHAANNKDGKEQKTKEGQPDVKEEDKSLLYCTYKYGKRTIICTWSEKRAKKDKAERDEKILKAQKLLKTPALIERKAKTYFLKPTTDNQQYILDTAKIELQTKFDGFKAIATNAADITPETVLEKYSELYKIEHSFRSFKSYLETRPMFHWTDKRIEGHLVLCYISFCMLNYLQQYTGYTEQTIRRALDKTQVSKIIMDQELSWLRSEMSEEAGKIFEAINIKQLPNVIKDKDISNYMPSNL